MKFVVITKSQNIFKLSLFVLLGLLFWSITAAEAASLSLVPGTSVQPAGGIFTAQVVVNTQGSSINAADATLSFNPAELSVVSVNRTGSIFNLWVGEPTFSNSAGTISFSGGLPSGYTGSNGNVISVTFRAVGSGTARVSFASGSVLANDGRGSNVLTAMNGGTYTLQTAAVAPEPEIIEYIAAADTPTAPVIESDTHSNPNEWSQNTTAELSWSLPADITAVRTLLNNRPSSVPTILYETPIRSITLEDLPEGESYFHIQFRNEDGWGRVTSYRLAVDTEVPTDFTISQADDNDFTNPEQRLIFQAEDTTSGVSRYLIKIDSAEPYEFIDESGEGAVTLPVLQPGYRAVIVEAFDAAGNSVIETYSFTILAFDKPVFTDFPSEINEEVIPVIKGRTRPNSTVTVYLQKLGSEPSTYEIAAADDGTFNFIPDGSFSTGVYEIYAVATDSFGAMSEPSDTIKIAVQEPGYVRFGGFAISILSIIIPLFALIIIGGFSLWYLAVYLAKYRSRVSKESTEALDILHREFVTLQNTLRQHESSMQSSRKTKKLTKAETAMIEALDKALQSSQAAVEKEIVDVTKLSKKDKKNPT